MRLFVALLLDDDVRQGLASVQAKLAEACRGVRWVKPEQLHLTVKFLGEVKDDEVTGVSEAIERASGVGPFDLDITGAGCFPERGSVRIVWAGAGEETGRLVECVAWVESELERVGFAKDRRPWSAHITLGRVREDRSGGRLREAVEAFSFEPMRQRVEAIRVMCSVLSPNGPTYSVVSTAPLS